MDEFGIVIPKGIRNVGRVIEACESAKRPAAARKAMNLLADRLVDTQKRIAELSTNIHADAKANQAAKRLQTIPGTGPITANAFAASLPDITDFNSGSDLSAWIGLTPKPHSSGGTERLGRISKMGNRYLRRLLYLGAMSQVSACRRGQPSDDWLWKIMERKKPKQAAIALANRMARRICALLKTGTEFDQTKAT